MAHSTDARFRLDAKNFLGALQSFYSGPTLRCIKSRLRHADFLGREGERRPALCSTL